MKFHNKQSQSDLVVKIAFEFYVVNCLPWHYYPHAGLTPHNKLRNA